jgi:hypothetical protein
MNRIVARENLSENESNRLLFQEKGKQVILLLLKLERREKEFRSQFQVLMPKKVL